jgi:hypothetical protein
MGDSQTSNKLLSVIEIVDPEVGPSFSPITVTVPMNSDPSLICLIDKLLHDCDRVDTKSLVISSIITLTLTSSSVGLGKGYEGALPQVKDVYFLYLNLFELPPVYGLPPLVIEEPQIVVAGTNCSIKSDQ